MQVVPFFPAAALIFLTTFMTSPVLNAADDTAPATSGQLRPAVLRCESLTDPLGLGETVPRLSWTGESTRRAEVQNAYQILVASTPEALAKDQGDLWDTGKIDGAESAHVAYAGRPLASRAACFWKVRLWDRDDAPSAWSEPARWSVGLLSPQDWQARWIDTTQGNPASPALPSIEVQRAVYEAVDDPGQNRDVTAIIQGVVNDKRRDFAVMSAALGGDPAPGKRKVLRVDFSVGGQSASATFAEGRSVVLAALVRPPGYLRRTFPVNAPVRSATLYITALGLYEARLNGKRVGDHALAPEWTDYNRRVRYQAYDVTALLHTGDNALGALLADGWYAGHLGNGGFQQYGTVPALLAQLEITHPDGSVERVVSDNTWRTHASPVLTSDFMFGETYDARAELPAWDLAGFDDRAWTPATVRDEKPRALDPQVMPPVRQTAEKKPIAMTEPTPGHWTFDLGQNLVGVVRLKVNAPAGTKVTLHHAEMLNPDGTIYTTNLRGAPSTDTYVCRGGGEEVWQPRFTFHGFRYVELTGLPEKPAADAVTGVVLGTDNPRAGSFACSDERINQLVSNIEWGTRGNYLSVPTDCPQRDERLGWMGDAQVFARTATVVADVAAFFDKWLVDVDDAQRADGAFTDVSPFRGSNSGTPAWGDAGVICPWTMYAAYGDRRVLERHLPAMTKWVEWCRQHSTDLLRDKDRGADYGDWLSIGATTPKDVIGTAYFAYSTHLLAWSYRAVGDTANADKYDGLFADVRAAFNKAYVDPEGRIKGDTQCVYAMALRFDLLAVDLRPKAVQYLADDIAAKGNHLSTGFVGVSYLLPVLTAGGRLDVAYALLLQDTFPSWLFSVKQGATTIWERWDGWTPEKGFQTPAMNSFNHYSLGSCGEWLYDTVAGIDWDPDAPGYKHFVIHPRPGGTLTNAKGTLRTVYGQIGSAWTAADGKFTYDLTIPANTTATVTLPTADAAAITEGGKPLGEIKEAALVAPVDGNATFTLGSGAYRFVCPLAK